MKRTRKNNCFNSEKLNIMRNIHKELINNQIYHEESSTIIDEAC